MQMAKKIMREYKFSDKTIQRLEKLSARWEIPQTTVIELLVKKAELDNDIRPPVDKDEGPEDSSS